MVDQLKVKNIYEILVVNQVSGNNWWTKLVVMNGKWNIVVINNKAI